MLDAFEQCLVAHGPAGSSLDCIARTAGMSRQLLLHYFGERDALVRAAARRIVGRYRARIARQLAGLAGSERLDDFVRWVFAGDFCEPHTDAALRALRAHARCDPEIDDALRPVFAELVAVLRDELARAIPSAPSSALERTAFALTALCFGAGEMQSLGLAPPHAGDLHDSARALVAALRRADGPDAAGRRGAHP